MAKRDIFYDTKAGRTNLRVMAFMLIILGLVLVVLGILLGIRGAKGFWWQLVNEETHTSSTSRASYIPFPIIFFGANIEAQRIATPVTVDRIAPTVARAIRIRAPNACSAEPLF